MNGPYQSSDRFPGNGNANGNGDGFHRHSQSISHHFNLDFQSMMQPHMGGSGGGPPTASDASRLPGSAYESHDDLCVDRCMGVGLYNGFQQFNHRGAPPPLQARWARGNPISGYDDYSTGFGAMPVQFRPDAFAPPAASNSYQPWFNQHLNSSITCTDDDCQSMGDMSCCDSQCTMTGKCTDLACADTEDACTDQSCPSRSFTAPSSEVVSGAAALISINHAPEDPHHSFNLQQQGETYPPDVPSHLRS